MDNSRFKFRAWDDKLKVMFTHEKEKELGDEREPLWKIPAAVGGILNYSDGILMQYIGLKDKNGKEIYEGDILKTDGVPNVHVYWFEQEARWNLQYVDKITQDISNILMKILNYYEPQQENGPGTDCQLNDTISYTSEIIGNIYENPELL